MKMSYWMALPLVFGISALSVACGSPTPEVEEGAGEEEVMEEEGTTEEGMEEETMEEEEGASDE